MNTIAQIKVTVLVANQPTINGHIYSRECIKAAVDAVHGKLLALSAYLSDDPFSTELVDLAGGVTSVSSPNDGQTMVIELNILDTPKGLKMLEILTTNPEKLSITPSGIGLIDEQKRITNYKLTSFGVGLNE